MCLIVAKPKGVNLPKNKKLHVWFKSHPDGFGLAYLLGNQVTILKGALVEEDMFKLIKKMKRKLRGVPLKSVDIILHFRQATNGSTSPENCHPFPITGDEKALSALEVETDCALAHNGIIMDYASYSSGRWEYPILGKTDTQMFIEDYVVRLGDSLWNGAVQDLIGAYTNSKFALLSKQGITYIGEFIEENGYYYSNGGYKEAKPIAIKVGLPYPALPFYEYNDFDYRMQLYQQNDILEVACDLCGQPHTALYEIPDDESLVCFLCYQQLTGRTPEEEERAI